MLVVGRPPSLSPIGSLCSKCLVPMSNKLTHACASKKESAEFMKVRLEKNKLTGAVVNTIIDENSVCLPNLHGKPTQIHKG